MSGVSVPMWRESPERWAERRAQFIESEYDLEQRHAVTVAYSELGYSSSGIAKRTGFAEGTVRGYLDTLAEELGEAVLWAKRSDRLELDGELGPGGSNG
jgi:transposase